MEFFKKIKNSILGLFGLGKVKTKEVEAKIEEKIESVKATIQTQSEPVKEKAEVVEQVKVEV